MENSNNKELKFSLAEIAELAECKSYITKDRFFYYFSNRTDLSERDIRTLYESLFLKLPYRLGYHLENEDIPTIEFVVKESLKILHEIKNSWGKTPRIKIDNEQDKLMVKIIYAESEDSSDYQEMEINLYYSIDVISYAELLKRENVEIKAMLNFQDNIREAGTDKYFNVYKGDYFCVNDDFWKKGAGNVFVADGEGLSRLLYTKGKGYLKNGKPNYDEEEGRNKWRTMALSNYRKETTKMGNIYIDLTPLKD